jgi:hypothetical protein
MKSVLSGVRLGLAMLLGAGVGAAGPGISVLLVSVTSPSSAQAQPANYPESCTPGPYKNEEACRADLHAQEDANCIAGGGHMTSQGTFGRACVIPPGGGGYNPAANAGGAQQYHPAGSHVAMMTRAQCNAAGGASESTVTTPEDPDPVRRCTLGGLSQRDIQQQRAAAERARAAREADCQTRNCASAQ